jgi:hypothetical protein
MDLDPHRVDQPRFRVPWNLSSLIADDPLCVVRSVLFFQKFTHITSMAQKSTESRPLDSELGAKWEYQHAGQSNGFSIHGAPFFHFFVCIRDCSSMEGNVGADRWGSIMVHLDPAIASC